MVPETFEGWAVLHEMYRLDWPRWNSIPPSEQKNILLEAKEHFSKVARPVKGHSALFSMIGHKADLLCLHFRPGFEELLEVETEFKRKEFSNFLIETTSYVSFVELGVYEMTAKLHGQLREQGLKPDTDEWSKAWAEGMEEQRKRMESRLYPEVPEMKYYCFYPMNKRRGEVKNWYATEMSERQRMMRDHGMIGRKYAGKVIQVISGSIGFDDWEWGVDLFASDPITFKKLIYEMRFDEASAFYAEFGPFYTGVRLPESDLEIFMTGKKSV